jgi:hypothetical protein
MALEVCIFHLYILTEYEWSYCVNDVPTVTVRRKLDVLSSLQTPPAGSHLNATISSVILLLHPLYLMT